MNNSYSIKDIISMLLSKIWLIILVTFLGGIVAFSISKFMISPKYSSHITMYVQSYKDISEDNNDGSISNSKQLVNTYREVMLDDAVMDALLIEVQKSSYVEKYGITLDLLRENYGVVAGTTDTISTASLRKSISIKTVDDTSAMVVTVTTKNAKLSAAVCNALAEIAPEKVEEAIGIGTINKIAEAKIYENPVSPSVIKNSIIGAFAALVIVVLVILAINFLDNSIKRASDLEERYKKPILGEVSKLNYDKKKIDLDTQKIKLTDKNVPFDIIESYKSIRTNVTFALSTAQEKIIVVSSPNPNEGKSTVSCNMAIALAQSGKKVLLIDGDLRKNRQDFIFEILNKKGLSSVISKQEKLEDCIQKNVVENLDVMTSGPIPPNPSELLGSEQMRNILKELSSVYDTIIIDTPPVNTVTDAMELAKVVSGIVIVVSHRKTSTTDVDEALKKIELCQLRVLGFILNNVNHEHDTGYYARYGKGYYKQYRTNARETENK